MVTIRLARHGAKKRPFYQLLSPTAVMHATVASLSALVSSTQSLAKRRRHPPGSGSHRSLGWRGATISDRVAALIKEVKSSLICHGGHDEQATRRTSTR